MASVTQPPLTAAISHNMIAAHNIRQRVKAKAPKWLEAVADNKLPTAQHTAANKAKYSKGTNKFLKINNDHRGRR